MLLELAKLSGLKSKIKKRIVNKHKEVVLVDTKKNGKKIKGTLNT